MSKRLSILCVVMAVLIAGVLFSYRDNGQPALSQAEGDLIFPKLQQELNTISRIEISQGSVTSTIQKDEKNIWHVKEKADYPANLIMVRGLISAFARSYFLEEKSAKEEYYKHFGLDEKHMRTVSLYAGGDAPVATLRVGLQKASRDGTFVRRPEEAKVWLVKYNLAYNVAPEEWIQRELLSVPASEIKSVTITKTGEPEVHIYREQQGGALRLADVPVGKTVKDPIQLTGVLAMFEPLTIEDVRPASELMSSSAEGIKLEMFDGRAVTLRFNKEGASVWVTVESDYVPVSTKEDGGRGWSEKLSMHAQGFTFKLPAVLKEKFDIKMKDLVQ